jgi:hypothetical protein
MYLVSSSHRPGQSAKEPGVPVSSAMFSRQSAQVPFHLVKDAVKRNINVNMSPPSQVLRHGNEEPFHQDSVKLPHH